MNKRQENETIENVLNGDREKFALLVDRYKGPVYNLVYRLTGSRDDAEDLAQEIFLKAYQSLNSFKIKRRFFPWLYTIAVNLTRNHLKKKKPILVKNVDRLPADKTSPEQAVSHQQEAEALARYIQRLPVSLREAIILRYYHYLHFEDISQILCISLSAAKMRVYRGLKKLEILMNKNTK
ncbi:MAG: sigma-70 family RNA polymerase sigma factor [Thermodesulfobacteriota bacterium]|nr:sigma-70 family RNA polymerase sigma factor [Thermodesulfobacteriota bacterium]